MKLGTKGIIRFRLLALFLTVLLLVNGAYASAFAAQGDEIHAAKKIISLVYDDSGSMSGDSWGYANYATQGLIALLNEQDELYITYLSEPDHSQAVDTSDLQTAVNAMHDWNNSGGTPAEAIYTARKTLDNISEEDPSVEYWMIVMTDGDFYDFQGADDLAGLLDSYAGNEMSNHNSLRIAYFAMGESAKTVPENTEKGLYSWHSKNEEGIVRGVNEMAGTVSGRIVADDAKQADDKTISFTSNLPMYSISVLSQNSKAVVNQAKTSEENLKVVRNTSLDANTKQSASLVLNGNAAVINKVDKSGDAAVIPADTYTIEFSEPVDIANLVIQYEPAIALLPEVKREGIDIDVQNDTISNEDTIDVSFMPVIPGTEDEIDAGDLPSGISWNISYCVDGTESYSANDRTLTGLKVEPGHNEIICTMKIPGFSDVVSRLSFDVEEHVIITNLNIETEQPDGLSYLRSDLGKKSIKSAQHVRFVLTNDGVALTKEDIESAGISLRISDTTADESETKKIVQLFGIKEGEAQLTQNDDGSYELIPGTAWGMPFVRPFTKAGNYEVTVEAGTEQTVTAKGIYKIVPGFKEWLDPIILIAIALLILYLIHTILIREKFPKCAVQLVKVKQSGEMAYRKDSPPQRLGLAQSLWPPFKKQSSCRCKASSGLVLVAENGGVSVKGKSLTNSGYNCYGRYMGEIPKAAEKSHVRYASVLKKMVRAKADNKNRVQINNQNVPTKGNLLIFCRENDKKARKDVTGILLR